MKKAYMIRNDGKEIPVMQHPYGNIDEITETLYAGEWLYDNTQYDSTREKFIQLIGEYAAHYEGLSNPDTVIQDLCAIIAGYPYKYLSTGFVEARKGDIIESFNTALQSGSKSRMQGLMHNIIDEINQEFLRARYGGLYNTSSSSREMVFRISSTKFNWYNIIWTFVYMNQKQIDSITIVRDEESTGMHNEFYHARDGVEYNQYPIADFLVEKGNPIIESNDLVGSLLQSGRPLNELWNLPMNKDRILYRYRCLVQQENRERKF